MHYIVKTVNVAMAAYRDDDWQDKRLTILPGSFLEYRLGHSGTYIYSPPPPPCIANSQIISGM